MLPILVWEESFINSPVSSFYEYLAVKQQEDSHYKHGAICRNLCLTSLSLTLSLSLAHTRTHVHAHTHTHTDTDQSQYLCVYVCVRWLLILIQEKCLSFPKVNRNILELLIYHLEPLCYQIDASSTKLSHISKYGCYLK